MEFSGSVRGCKKVSLRGTIKAADKLSILQKSEEARCKRELEKRVQSSTLLLQRWFRMKKARINFLSRLTQKLEEKMEQSLAAATLAGEQSLDSFVGILDLLSDHPHILNQCLLGRVSVHLTDQLLLRPDCFSSLSQKLSSVFLRDCIPELFSRTDLRRQQKEFLDLMFNPSSASSAVTSKHQIEEFLEQLRRHHLDLPPILIALINEGKMSLDDGLVVLEKSSSVSMQISDCRFFLDLLSTESISLSAQTRILWCCCEAALSDSAVDSAKCDFSRSTVDRLVNLLRSPYDSVAALSIQELSRSLSLVQRLCTKLQQKDSSLKQSIGQQLLLLKSDCIDHSVVKILTRDVTQNSSTSTSRGVEVMEDANEELVEVVFHLLASLLKEDPDSGPNLVAKLITGCPNVISYAVRVLRRINVPLPLPDSDEKMGLLWEIRPQEVSVDQMSFLKMLTVALDFFVSAFYDVEIFRILSDNQEWEFVCSSLKSIILTKYSKTKLFSKRLVASCAALLKKLQSLNFRRHFTSDKLWLADTVLKTVESRFSQRDFEDIIETPFLFEIDGRVEVLFQYTAQSPSRRRSRTFDIEVRRDHVFEDAMELFEQALSSGNSNLQSRFFVKFKNCHGIDEMGIDGGGLYKEFMEIFLLAAVDPNRGLFLTTDDGKLYPNPFVEDIEPDFEVFYNVIGRLIAKCILDSVFIDIFFSQFFLSKIVNRHSINDLVYLDPILYKNLLNLLDYEGDVENDLCLTFSYSEAGIRTTTYDLVPNGRNIPVTKANRMSFVAAVSNFRLNKQQYRQTQAFLHGFYSIINAKIIRIFSEQEIQILISGVSVLDVDDLRQNTIYESPFCDIHPVIEMFWQAVYSLKDEEKRRMLKFVTSSSQAPLLGFSFLRPKFSIAPFNSEKGYLPSASTCFNCLKLPIYSSFEEMREKLLYAITSTEGFELS